MKPGQSECVAILTKSPQPEKPTLLFAEIVEELLIVRVGWQTIQQVGGCTERNVIRLTTTGRMGVRMPCSMDWLEDEVAPSILERGTGSGNDFRI